MTPASLVVPLADASSAAEAGGKGASLGFLARAGVAVPPGFVVTAGAFAAAMSALDPAGALRAEISALPAGSLAEIGRVAAAFRARVVAAPLPPAVAAAISAGYAALGGDSADVAVRSSATVEDSADASFAGLQDTYLGVRGSAPVLDHVRRCWASLYNDESVAYRRRLGMAEDGVAMAVVVQRMVGPRSAGVLFTRSPVTGDRSVVAIEGTWGLGSALVSGDVTPDSFTVSKITGEITGRRVSPKGRLHSFIPNGPGRDRHRHPCCAARGGLPHRRRDPGARGRRPARWKPTTAPPRTSNGPCWTGTPRPPSAIVLLQSRPETVWAARTAAPVAAPKARPADHVLSLFGKPQ